MNLFNFSREHQEKLLKAVLEGESIEGVRLHFCPEIGKSTFYRKVSKLVNLRSRNKRAALKVQKGCTLKKLA